MLLEFKTDEDGHYFLAKQYYSQRVPFQVTTGHAFTRTTASHLAANTAARKAKKEIG